MIDALTKQVRRLIESLDKGKQREEQTTPSQGETTPPLEPTSTLSATRRESKLVKELIRLIPRYDETGGAQKLNDYTSNFENYVARSQDSNEDKLALVTAKLCGDASM